MSASFKTTPSPCTFIYTSPIVLRAFADLLSIPRFASSLLPPTHRPFLQSSVFLPASDIPRFVAHGSVSLGITGQDVILESGLSDLVTELLPLDFGKCALQVQVPVSSPFQTLESLAGKRVVSSFEVISGKLFKEVDTRAGLSGEQATKVEYVGGSVEAACALGMADGIVDLVGESSTFLFGFSSSSQSRRETITSENRRSS